MSLFPKFAIACYQHPRRPDIPYYYTGNEGESYPPRWSWRTDCAIGFYSFEIASQWLRELIARKTLTNYDMVADMFVKEIT